MRCRSAVRELTFDSLSTDPSGWLTRMHPVHRTSEPGEILAAERVLQQFIACSGGFRNKNEVGTPDLYDSRPLRHQVRICEESLKSRTIERRVILRLDRRNDMIFKPVTKKNVRTVQDTHRQDASSV